MKNKKFLLVFLALCLILVPLSATEVFADVGGGVDWDQGPSSGGGGGGGGGGDIGIPFWLIFYAGDNPIFLIIIIAIVVINVRNRKKRSNNSGQTRTSTASGPRPQRADIRGRDKNLDALTARDPNFSKHGFLSRVSNVFVTLQDAWTDKDWKSIRTFESNQLFNQHQRQLNEFVEKGQTNVVEDIAVMSTEIEEYTEDANSSYLSAILTARYKDYVIEDESGKVVKGDPSRRYLMTYRMNFMRDLEAQTRPQGETSVTTCPNCGANLSINQHGICEYCGSEVTTGAQQWVLTSLQPIHQETL